MHWPVGSGPPAATAVQVPTVPVRAHDRHVPEQVVAQQTPWAQTVLWHSLPNWQTAPFGFSPQDPALQVAGDAQSAAVAQVDRQAFRPHPNGKHEVAAGIVQVPAPSQVPSAVKVSPVIGQLAFAQAVPCGYFWQAPAWHLPSFPHEVCPLSVQSAAGSGSPVGTAVHSPIVPVIAHEKHDPVQAVAQQTPWAHWPDLHSVPVEQNAPFGLRPHEAWTHTLPGEQAVSLPQEL
jgi:hypothetical protein